jgi:hypothetical protein
VAVAVFCCNAVDLSLLRVASIPTQFTEDSVPFAPHHGIVTATIFCAKLYVYLKVVLAWAWGFHSTDPEILFKNILRNVASPSPIARFSHLTTRNKEYLHKTEAK